MVSGIEIYVFLCTPVFCAWTCERFEGQKQNRVFFWRRTNPWTNRGQTVERHQKAMERHKKVVERHKKVVDAGIKYPKLEFVVCSALIPKILE